MKLSEQQLMLDIALLVSRQSKAQRLQVGGVVCDINGNLVAYAYNGTHHGADNCCEIQVYDGDNFTHVDEQGQPYKLVTKSSVIHCENNLIAHAARRGISINGGTVFITHSPCNHCTALMIQAGIVRVVFLDKHNTYNDVVKLYSNFINIEEWIKP